MCYTHTHTYTPDVKRLACSSLVRSKLEYGYVVLQQRTKRNADSIGGFKGLPVGGFIFNKNKTTISQSALIQQNNIMSLECCRKEARLNVLENERKGSDELVIR